MGAQFPTRVSAGGGIYVHKDREVPDTYSTTIEYPNFYIEMSGSMANAGMGQYHKQAIYGHKGTLVIDRGQILVYPETFPGTSRTVAARAGARPSRRPSRCLRKRRNVDARTPHTTNFFACVRSRKQPNAPAEIGHRSLRRSSWACMPIAKARQAV